VHRTDPEIASVCGGGQGISAHTHTPLGGWPTSACSVRPRNTPTASLSPVSPLRSSRPFHLFLRSHQPSTLTAGIIYARQVAGVIATATHEHVPDENVQTEAFPSQRAKPWACSVRLSPDTASRTPLESSTERFSNSTLRRAQHACCRRGLW
jgi:hypothetical protein